MTPDEARWMQLKRFAEEQIADIHTAERKWYATKSPEKRNYWRDASHIIFQNLNTMFGPAWHRNKTEQDRADEVTSWTRAIYPIWKPILEDFTIPTDIEAMHKADIAVWRKSPEINAGAHLISAVAGIRRGDT